MKGRIITRDCHRIIISPIDDKQVKVTYYENMGGRWVKLGPSEIWCTEDAKSEFLFK